MSKRRLGGRHNSGRTKVVKASKVATIKRYHVAMACSSCGHKEQIHGSHVAHVNKPRCNLCGGPMNLESEA